MVRFLILFKEGEKEKQKDFQKNFSLYTQLHMITQGDLVVRAGVWQALLSALLLIHRITLGKSLNLTFP